MASNSIPSSRSLAALLRWLLPLVVVVSTSRASAQGLPLAGGVTLLPPAAFDRLPRASLPSAAAAPPGASSAPESSSLEDDFPAPGDQGGLGTCTGWAVSAAVAYHVHRARGVTLDGTVEPHSAMFLYGHVAADPTCTRGMWIDAALDFAKSDGVAPLYLAPYASDRCEQSFSAEAGQKAAERRISGWGTVAVGDLDELRAQLRAGRPIVFSMEVSRAFQELRADTYDLEPEADRAACHSASGNCLHAMVLLGYDDARQAFRVQNSWGAWSDHGRAWVTYAAWRAQAKQGYAVYGLAPRSAVQCRGAMRWSVAAHRCDCPQGTAPTADGSDCAPAACDGGRLRDPLNAACVCPTGERWEAEAGRCVPSDGAVPAQAPVVVAEGRPWEVAVSGRRLVGYGPPDEATPLCPGFYGLRPDAIIAVPEGAGSLQVRTSAEVDTTLLVEGPDGAVWCNDDDPANARATDARVLLRAPTAGVYRIHVGTFERDTEFRGTVRVERGAGVSVAVEALPPGAGGWRRPTMSVDTDVPFAR